MNSFIRTSTIALSMLTGAVLFLVGLAVVSISGVTHAESTIATKNGRLITIHDRGIDMVVLSEAATVGDVLAKAGVIVDPNDAVEPSIDEKLVASDYQINIYRARPVIIVDGNVRTKTVTPYQTALQIAQSAGITLYDEDKTVLERTDNIIADGAGLKLTIERSKPFELTLYGKVSTVRTQGATISAMLIEKGIKLNADDRISPGIDDTLNTGMAVRIWREGKQTITVDEPVDFRVEKIENADLSVGYREVQTVGTVGLRSVSYEITIQDGKEVNRTEIASITIKQPTNQIEVVGVKGQYTTPSENETITWNYLTSHGFNAIQAAGIMGNLMQEHHFNTTGDGLAQWTGGRKSDLYSRVAPNNIYTQLDFLMEELNGKYSYVKTEIMSTDNLTEAVRIFQNKFERCGICREDQRIIFAQNILGSH
jgi:uncharacterized protein YabE (DUF348 family)